MGSEGLRTTVSTILPPRWKCTRSSWTRNELLHMQLAHTKKQRTQLDAEKLLDTYSRTNLTRKYCSTMVFCRGGDLS